ncbi:MAG: division plane positioning ATPase MipZ [Rhodospirillaceae bacterium]
MRPSSTPRIVVFGNEKGGTGKSTLAMHLAVALMNRRLSVATVDLDARQGTLSKYVANRKRYQERTGHPIPLPAHHAITSKTDESGYELELPRVLAETGGHDIVVVDTPGFDTTLSQLGHSYADVIVTPMNDSLIDLDVMSDVDPQKQTIVRPSHYAERVWRAKQLRAKRDGGSIDWVVLRNRLGQLEARNKRLVAKLLADLSKRIGFRLVDGIAERVVYRELFLDGLTVEDLAALAKDGALAMSHVAARQELRALMISLGLKDTLDNARISA